LSMRMTCVGLGCRSGNCLGSDAGCATSGAVVAANSSAAKAAQCQSFCIGSPPSSQGADLATTAADLKPKPAVVMALLEQAPAAAMPGGSRGRPGDVARGMPGARRPVHLSDPTILPPRSIGEMLANRWFAKRSGRLRLLVGRRTASQVPSNRLFFQFRSARSYDRH
jgi:hypothetical protein